MLRLFLGLRCGVPPRQTQTDNDASGNPQRVSGRLCQDVPYGIAYRRWERKRSQIAKKIHGNGLMCRGCPKPFWPVRCRPSGGAGRLPKRTAVAGQPVVRFGHTYSCMMVGFYEPRTTNHEPLFFHEPRATRGDVALLNLSPCMSLGMYTGFTRDALWASPTEAASGRRAVRPQTR